VEIVYDDLDGKWRVFQAVETRPSIEPKGSKTCHIDLGAINLATIWVEGWRQSIAFSGRRLLSGWWYWTKRIAKYQSQLKRVNDRHTSEQLRRLYRIRQRRFRHAVNAMARNMVEDLYELGVSRIVVGKLRHIRDNNGYNGHRTNSMIHNFWSFQYITQRIRDVAEEYGIMVKEVSEYRTSSICPICGSENTTCKGRLFKCLDCGLEGHRDAAGVLNIGSRQGENINGVVAYPLLLRWNGMRWEPRRAMNNRSNEHSRSKNLPTLVVESVKDPYGIVGQVWSTSGSWKDVVKRECHLAATVDAFLSPFTLLHVLPDRGRP
jgi:putative transposase